MPDMPRLRAFLRGKLDPADFVAACRMLDDNGMDPGEMAGDEPPPFPGRPRPGGAMDRAAVREMQAIRTAEAAVAPHVGAVLGMDSADRVYAEAIRRLGRSTAGLHPSAMKATFDMLTGSTARRALAMDSAAADTRLAARFPNIDRLRA